MLGDEALCGEVWGSQCRARVYAPHYTHANHPAKVMMRRVARQPQIDPAILQILVAHQDTKLRGLLAQNVHLGAEWLRRLYTDSQHYVRYYVCDNHNCPPSVLRSAVYDRSRWPRIATANNPECPTDVLLQLSRDVHPSVRVQALSNPNLPAHIKAIAQAGGLIEPDVHTLSAA